MSSLVKGETTTSNEIQKFKCELLIIHTKGVSAYPTLHFGMYITIEQKVPIAKAGDSSQWLLPESGEDIPFGHIWPCKREKKAKTKLEHLTVP